jgi:long-chain acyl-CoA synthetase
MRCGMPLTAAEAGLAHHAVTRPQHPAVLFGDRCVDYATLNRRVNRLARALRRQGVAERQTIAAVLPNGIEWIELLNAAGKLGALVVPVGHRLKAAEIAYLLRDADARLMVSAPSLREEVDRALVELAWSDDRVWVIGSESPWRGCSYEELLAAEADDEPGPSFTGGGFNALVYTSGTTGRPKGIERPYDPASAHLPLLGVAHLWGIGPEDVHLVNGPLYHTAPSSYAQAHLLVGATVVLVDHFDARQALDLIDRWRVTTTFMVPTHFSRIVQLEPQQRASFRGDSLRLVLHSAAPCPVHVKRAILEIFPAPSVTEFYGASESGFTKISAAEWLRKPGSVGRPWPGHEIRILDEEGRECPTGTIGLIYVRSPALAFQYRGAGDKTRGAFREGFFTAGDLGHLDADGYLYIADRRTDLILSGGANVYPAEVEATLSQHPAVADCAVIGVPDADLGKTVLAVVELRPGATAGATELIAFTRRRLAHYKCPRRVEIVDRLPREPNGKVRKHLLVERLASG